MWGGLVTLFLHSTELIYTWFIISYVTFNTISGGISTPLSKKIETGVRKHSWLLRLGLQRSDRLTEGSLPLSVCFLCVWQCSGHCGIGRGVMEGETNKDKTAFASRSFQYALDMRLLFCKVK